MKKSKLEALSDSELYSLAKEFGMNARLWKRKFAGLLPEISKRRLHRKRNFTSIYEFAFKLCGMSERSVDRVLNLSKKLEQTPILNKQLESGEQSWSKLEIVSHLASTETDKEWAEKVDRLSYRALQSYVMEYQRELTESGNASSVIGADHAEHEFEWSQISFKLKREVEQKLRIFKQKLEKEKGETLTFNEVLEALISNEKSNNPTPIIKVCPECAKKKGQNSTSRNIPSEVRRLIQAKYSGKCAFPTCKNASSSLHHTRRFSLNKNNDPDFIVPLCSPHERLVHSGLIANEEASPKEWKLKRQPNLHDPKFQIDLAVGRHRREPYSLSKHQNFAIMT